MSMPVYTHVQEQTQSPGVHSTTGVTRSPGRHAHRNTDTLHTRVTAAHRHVDLCMRQELLANCAKYFPGSTLRLFQHHSCLPAQLWGECAGSLVSVAAHSEFGRITVPDTYSTLEVLRGSS